MPNARREFLSMIIEGIGGGSTFCQLGCSSNKQPAASHDASTVWAANVAHIEKRIPQLMMVLHVPGVSVAIIRGARIAWRKGFGVKDQISRAPVTDDTVFE